MIQRFIALDNFALNLAAFRYKYTVNVWLKKLYILGGNLYI